jgi:hypothetical protein
MKLICEIELPDTADFSDKLEAMARASSDERLWRTVYTREETMKRTSLDNKCGSCKYFKPFNDPMYTSAGTCGLGHVWGQRSRPACKKYERK